MNKQILLIFITCTVCLLFGTPDYDCYLNCLSAFNQALMEEPKFKGIDFFDNTVITFQIGPFFREETLWDLYCQTLEQFENCLSLCAGKWSSPSQYLCERVEAVKNQTKCFDENNFGQRYDSVIEAELHDPIYAMCTRVTHWRDEGTLESSTSAKIINNKVNIKNRNEALRLRNECLYISCYLKGYKARGGPNCNKSVMLVRSMIHHDYMKKMYVFLEKRNETHYFPEECKSLLMEGINRTTITKYSVKDFQKLLPPKCYIFNHVRQWGNSNENISVVFLFPHPLFNHEYNLLKPHIIEYLKDNGIPAIPDLAYNVTCSVSPCKSSICNYTHQCLEYNVNYCRMQVYVQQDMINRTWTCQIALVLTATNVVLLPPTKDYIWKLRSQPPVPVPEILIKGLFMVKGQPRITVMKMETLSLTIQHFGDSLIYNGDGQPDKQTNVDFPNQFKVYCKDSFSGIYYGVNRKRNSIGMVSQYHNFTYSSTKIHFIYEATKLGSIICLPTESSILWSENNGTHWHIKKARIEIGAQVSVEMVDTNWSCWKNHLLKNGLLANHWPIYYRVGHQGISFATDQGIWAADSNGNNCKWLYWENWTNIDMQGIATDFIYVYWISGLKVFMADVNGSAKIELSAFWHKPLAMQIVTYGPEQFAFIPKECLTMKVDKPQIVGNKVYVSTKWNQSEKCQNISHPPVKIDLKLCDVINCTIYHSKQLFTFGMNHSFTIQNVENKKISMMNAVATIPQEFEYGLNNCSGGFCQINQSYMAHTTKTKLNSFWIAIIIAGISLTCILLIAILGLIIAYRIQSKVIFHGIKRITGSSIWVIEKIGSGWSEKSQVYRVVVTLANGMNKKKAMKAVTNKKTKTQMLFARFRLAREAAFLTNDKLININILKGFGVCLQGDATFTNGQNYGKEVLLMELCDGSLQNYLEGKREEQSMNLQKLVAIMIDIANGLNHLHKHSIIHNDLSVDNILYVTVSNTTPNGLTIICKIADFELSKEVSKIYKASEDTPFPVAHSAPEVLMHKELSKASDVWTMGVCFFQILMYGKNPWDFFNKREKVVDVICDPNVMLRLPAQTPKSLADIINPCFEFDSDDRPTAKAILEKLKTYMKCLTTNNEGIAQWMDESDPNELLFWSSPIQPVDPGYDTEVAVGSPVDLQSFTPTTSSIEQESVARETNA